MKRRMPINSASGYGKVCEEIMSAVKKITGRSKIGKELANRIYDTLEDFPEYSNNQFYLD